MPNFFLSRHSVLALLIGCYLLPVIVISAYGVSIAPQEESWTLLSLGLLLSLLGSIAIFFTTYYWELSLLAKKSVPPINKEEAASPHQLLEAGEKVAMMRDQLEQKEKELETLREEAEHFYVRKTQLLEEFEGRKGSLEEELKQKNIVIAEYKQTIADQRAVIEKKQKQLEKHEGKVNDLTDEIKTLLHLAENPSSPVKAKPQQVEAPQYKGSDDAGQQLKRCIDIAQKMTGVNPFANTTARFRDLPVDNIALDQRRLFDRLQSEHTSPVLVYSPKEKKMLFANDQVREMLGWSPDRFSQNFSDFVQDGLEEWKEKISHLNPYEESDVRLLMKTKTGRERLVHCRMAAVPSGIFRNHIINIFYN